MFIDIAKIKVKAGDGGDGAVAFHREKYVASGGPDGGDGGRGGDIVFRVDDNLSTLADFRYKRKYTAERGENGRGKRCFGKSAQPLVITVPRGTLIRNAETGRIMADMSTDEDVVIAKGGRGGWGNTHFASPTRQTPRFAKPGTPGEAFELQLELKLLADVGLVGFPNVGKSTLVSVVSEAKPNIANYHFTTITPVLGVVHMPNAPSFVMADIPGLIEGAHEGRGLGHEFLRHIERTALIVHVVDLTGDYEGRDPLNDYEVINRELELYASDLASRPRIVVANKIDVPGTEEICKKLAERVRADSIAAAGGDEFADSPIDPKLYCISALTGKGVDSLKAAIATKVHELREEARAKAAEQPEFDHVWEHKREMRDRRFTVRKLSDGVFRVEGGQVERMVIQTDWENEDAIAFLQHRFKRIGVEDALAKAGARNGDEIRIVGRAFEFESATADDAFEELDI